MYRIKSIPEDFIVKEITNLKLKKNGDYSIFLIKKRDFTTIKSIQIIANKLKIKLKRIGFAGIKDKKAITEQYISIFKTNIKDLNLGNIALKYIGKLDKPISLGDLKGNEFKITVRNVSKIKKVRKIPNYFGQQRFSKNNKDIGKNIVQNNFNKAVNLIIKDDKEYGDKIKKFLKENKNNYVGGLRLIPIKILKLYVHSYQSYIWNLTVDKYLKNIKKYKKKVPLIGFGTEIIDEKIKRIIDNILKKEKINLRDFIIKSFPELSAEGGYRDLFIDIKNFKYKIINDKIEFSFFLPKGCYATTVIEFLLK